MALSEDVFTGDVTTMATVGPGVNGSAAIISKAEGVIAGLPVAEEVFRQVDAALRFDKVVADGDVVMPGQVVARVVGSARSLLIAERTALNLLQQLSGVATLTRRFVEAVGGVGRDLRDEEDVRDQRDRNQTRIVDTRKTVPGLRALQKYAVCMGGGHSHRMGLYDAVMIKDNHIVASGGIARAVRAARNAISHTQTITVECESLEHVNEALRAGADILLLDNMTLDLLRSSVELCRGRALTEASGGVNISTVRAIAETGVDLISVGALTHSAPALDLSLDLTVTPIG